MKILRLAVFNVLNGAVSYNSITVPVADEKRRIPQTANLFIILGNQQETDESPDAAFITNSSIDIEIHHKTDYEVSKDVIDDVSNSILTLLIPTPGTHGLPVQNLMQILSVNRASAASRNFAVTDSGSVVSKVITITCRIIQQSP
jgi:hypothetical protein